MDHELVQAVGAGASVGVSAMATNPGYLGITTIILEPSDACGTKLPPVYTGDVLINQTMVIAEESTLTGNCTVQNTTLHLQANYLVSWVMRIKSDAVFSVLNGSLTTDFFDCEPGAKVVVTIERPPQSPIMIPVAKFQRTTFSTANQRNGLTVVTTFPEDCIQTVSDPQLTQGSMSVLVSSQNVCPSSSSEGLPLGAIIGIAVGGVVVAIGVTLLVVYFTKKEIHTRTRAQTEDITRKEIANLNHTSHQNLTAAANVI